MSDKKHMEYCVKLGNPWVQEKLDKMNQGIYIETPKVQNGQIREQLGDFMNNKKKNWDSWS